MRRIAIAVAASTMTFSLAACGALGAASGSEASPTKGDDITVGVLMPEKTNTRYEEFDYPIIQRKVAELTDKKGKTLYANGESDAKKQATQMQQMIDEKVDVILLDAVDSHAIAGMVTKAKDAGIPVIAYDRLAEGPIAAYVSFDNELVGEVQGRSIVEALGSGIDTSDKIVMINGSPSDPNAGQFKAGAMSELNGKVTIAKTYDVDGWKPETAQKDMTEAISAIGKGNIKAVYSANDAMAGAAIQAMEDAGMTNIPPITGQDAELAAVQRIVSGEQYMSVYKPYPGEAEAAAEMAVMKVQGKGIQFDALATDSVDSPTDKNIPAQLVQVVALTKDNIKSTVVKDGIYTIKDICTAQFKSDCAAAGLK
ncbi:sugar ABC transporter substrate-binding protein [Streptomyces canus]|uniref:D-xylose transport system substrate-binding protein n=1 Tax=Streptomyces canus TaxID=58343 RepID=A0AAW8FGH6_9ACTN|nr:substrate-binding domain-containing protein [Streptomyces canus]MDQ0762578.1 D-xylose transport system substrate-binding protein [Streptomyces canus]MDQ0908953.1 D-xylose transport system substrate-binding protein [Streptomyces canus]MDQ1068980.1 D-xylose transport system substrate-binding protein [Streptomyces canus]